VSTELPDDVAAALATHAGTVRAYALEQALKYALGASEALDNDQHVARAHVTCMAEVSRSWSALAEALGVRP
jgi:cation transport regulator ChaB